MKDLYCTNKVFIRPVSSSVKQLDTFISGLEASSCSFAKVTIVFCIVFQLSRIVSLYLNQSALRAMSSYYLRGNKVW